jgi:hypothetical protein
MITAIYARKSARHQISCDRGAPIGSCGGSIFCERRGGLAALSVLSSGAVGPQAARARVQRASVHSWRRFDRCSS